MDIDRINDAAVSYSVGFLEEWLTQSAARGTPASHQLLDNFKVLQVAIANYKQTIRNLEYKLDLIKGIL
jgi:hypothetical protein